MKPRRKAKKLIKHMTKVSQRIRTQRRHTNSPLWRRKALAIWSFIVRRYDKCEVCGATGKLDAHHLLPKERYQWWMFAPVNGVCLCKTCHKIGKLSAHRNPLWFALWLKINMPGRYNWAVKHIYDEPKTPPDFKAAHDYLLKRLYGSGLGPKYEARMTSRAEQSKLTRKKKT